MQDLPTETFLTQIGQNLHRRGQRVAFSGSQEQDRLPGKALQGRQKFLEKALGSSRPDIDQRQIRTVVFVIVPLEGIFNAKAVKEFLGHGIHSCLVVKR